MKLLPLYLSIGMLAISTLFSLLRAQDVIRPWQQYMNVAEAGFDTERLEAVRQQFRKQGGTALLIIRNGHVVLSEGPTARSFRQASIRKSYLNALYGIYRERGQIELDRTLAELGIDDLEGLTPQEHQATILDLLAARSGVYHPAAYSPESMEKNMPARGSHAPGTFWFYNNWDFNTLGAIFNQVTGEDLFRAFEANIARPLGFEDFSLQKTKYLYEPDRSQYPAYLFRMSARDMARFGLLYLQEGTFAGRRILSPEWIELSFAVHSENGLAPDGVRWDDYGLLWWRSNQIETEPVIYASGTGVQRISLFPESDMIMVHVVDTYRQPQRVGEGRVDDLTRQLLAAKADRPVPDPALHPYRPEREAIELLPIPADELKPFVGQYRHPRLGPITIALQDTALRLEAGIGDFVLYPVGRNLFVSEDIQLPMYFHPNDATHPTGTATTEINDQRQISAFHFFY